MFLLVFTPVTLLGQERQKIDRTQPVKPVTKKKDTTPTNKKKSTSNASSRKQGTSSSNSYLYISSTTANFDSKGGSKTFYINSSDSWEISTNTNSWGHLTRNGNQLTLHVDANTKDSSRSDYFILSSGTKTLRVNISQEGGTTLSLSIQDLHFDEDGGSAYVMVTSNTAWNIGTGVQSWGHLQIDNKLESVFVKVDANNSISNRKDFFTIKADDKELKVNITQDGKRKQNRSTPSNSSISRTSSNYTQTNTYNNYPYNSSTWSRRGHFNSKMDNYWGGLSVGYIQKQWTYEYTNGETEKMGMFDDDKYLQGVQAGLRIDPQFGAGFGMNSGLFYEYCWAKSNDEYDEYGAYYYTYKEHGLYLPLHLKFTMNYSKWFQLSIYGGGGVNYAISGKAYLKDEDETYDSAEVFSEDDWRRWNFMLEYGASLRINALQFDFTMSKGLNDWSDNNLYKIKQGRPFAVSMTVCF